MKRVVLAWVFCATACGDDQAKPDAGPPVVDIDNGSCGDQLHFTGEVVDWDSSDATFCGVFEAMLLVPPDGAMDTTAPNGRIDMCIPATQATTTISVTPSANASQCAGSTYPVPGAIIVNRDVIRAGAPFSARLFTATRETSFFTQIGAPYDASKAQLLVFVAGTPRPVSIAATHGATQAFTKATATWAAGDTGTYVFFANVAPGSTTITVTGGAFGSGPIDLAAGRITATNVYAL